MHAADDVGDDGLGSVIHAPFLPQLGIELFQEILVQVYDGVFPGSLAAEVPDDGREIGFGTVEEAYYLVDPKIVEVEVLIAPASFKE
jgi:hypothetical protein